METNVIELSGISKAYRRHVVLGPLDLSIRKGEIYGLVGENGAGKSTLIRIMTGLTHPSTGSVSLFGRTSPRESNQQRARTGYLPDGSALYPSMSAHDNLEIRRTEWGISDKKCIERALVEVGLSDVGRKKVRSYSLGMKRRLDLAVALLGEPELLILDEPTNGLDPTGIIETRELLKRLNRERGVTIIASSHILTELHEMATQYAFLSRGKLVKNMSATELDRCDNGNLEACYAKIVSAGAPR
ncbi:ABC transporter ATP-binding protein [Eggerthella sinensis]|uniref:ABC transporter ATP-binding protein n=1 Tax=Eggerthella sinensis TaxID=242230 RepID=UPI001D076D1C|nr:ABC transporter ATP-binding protein [Eggerthella sinensis]MCB7038195.1 ABC transporter ATP-binding protein [Eggerthella sinensis]